MKHGKLVRTVAYACAAIAITGCESPERALAPGGPSRIPLCEDIDCAPPPPPEPGGVFGKFGLVIGNNATAPELDALTELHVNLVRLSVDWGHERAVPGWAPQQMENLHDRGIDVLANVAYRYSQDSRDTLITKPDFAPCALSAEEYGCVPTGAAWDEFYADWVEFVNRMVRQNHRHAMYWSAWNEPNETHFFTGRASQYDSLANALCNAVWTTRRDSSNTQLQCVGPDLAIHRPFQEGAGTEWGWLQERMDNVNFDIVSIHWYEGIADVRNKTRQVKTMFPGKPVWVTETAMPDPTYREAAGDPEFQEEDLVAKWLDLRSGTGPIDALFYYDLSSRGGGITQEFAHPRPAYHALKRLNEGSYADPIPGNCSFAYGNGLCEYTSWIPLDYGCRIDAYVRRTNGQVVAGATILAKVALADGRTELLGYRKTNAAGVASFTAHCGLPHSVSFTNGGVLRFSGTGNSGNLYVDTSNRLAVHTFYVW